MAANPGWYGEWFAGGWFPSVWFAPGDESAVPPNELQPGFASSTGSGGGGKLSRAIAGKQRRPGQFGKQDRLRADQEYDTEYTEFRDKILEPVDIDADDEEILLLLVQMVGEL